MALGIASMLLSPAAYAITAATLPTDWTGLGSDPTNWSDPNNWDNGVPTSSVPANFLTGTSVNIGNISQPAGMVTVDNNTAVTLLPNNTLNDDMILGDTGTGFFTNSSSTHNVIGNLILGNQYGSNGTYTISGDPGVTSVNFAGTPGSAAPETPNGALLVGNNGTGNFVQGINPADNANQVNVAGDVVLGAQSSGTGTYTINSGTLTVGGAMIVGEQSTSGNVFTQNAGTVNITGTAGSDSRYSQVVSGGFSDNNSGALYVGALSTNDNGSGTYNMYGGALNASQIVLGYAGTGTFNQNSGTVTTSYVDMGDCGGCNGGNSAGFYNLTANGILNTGDLSVGDFGHGEFLQNGDNTQVNTSGTLSLGNGATAQPNIANPGNYDRSGLYTLDAGSLNTNYTVVGSQGTGTFVQNGGSQYVTSALTVGQQYSTPSGPLGSGTPSNIVFGGPSIGLYTMAGGILNVGGDASTGVDTTNVGILVGDAGTGTFNQTGGQVTSGNAGGQEGDLLIGAQAGSTGVYSLTDPNNAGNVSLIVNGNVEIGRDAASNGLAAANGTVTIGSGTDSPSFQTVATGNANGDVTVGDAGNGTLNVNSGTASIAGNLNAGVNGTGTINQSGGAVNASYVDLSTAVGSGSSSYTMTGGTLATTNDLNVGGGGAGSATFTQSGATTQTNVGGALRVGNSANTASLALNGGQLTVTGDSSVGVGSFAGSMTQSAGSFTTQTLTVGNGVSGTFTQTAGNTNVLGTMTVGNQGTATLTGLQANSIVNNNNLILSNAAITAPITNNGALSGTGTVTGDITNSGVIHPGALNTPGTLNIIGDLNLQSNSMMDFSLNGTTAGTGYSQLNVSKSITLAGSADILDSSFMLSSGENFALLTAGSNISGLISILSFDNAVCSASSGSFLCQGNGQNIDFKEVITGQAVDFQVASVSSVPLPGSAWMFFSAIAGLTGFGVVRQRKLAAVS
jgi:hypothetical protein